MRIRTTTVVRRTIGVAAAAAAFATALAIGGPAAYAGKPAPGDGDRIGVCERYSDGTGDLCLYYFTGALGSRAAVYSDDADLSDNLFATAAPGQGQSVSNNAESFWNLDTIWTAHLCKGLNRGGGCYTVTPGVAGNLPADYQNNVESIYWTQ